MAVDRLYHQKQQTVLRRALHQDYFMLINHGAKRSGKTVVDNDLFLFELRRTKRNAAVAGIQNPQYILAASDLGSVHRNVLNELSSKYGLEFHFDKFNRFFLFGVQVCCFGHSKINDLGRIRGMTAWGAYINEASVANEAVFDEIKSRCSGNGARLLMDTNPDRPDHWLKRDYIDKADGKTIVEYSWKLDDNTFLTDRYRDSIKASTPSGMFYDRAINGAWASADGMVYPDFDRQVHYVSLSQVPMDKIVRWFVGVDFGWEHYGAFVLIGVTEDKHYYLVQEWAAQHRHIDWWVEVAHSIKAQRGDINFYCDGARPDYVQKLRESGIRALYARKDVVAGISEVASLYKQQRFFIVQENAPRFAEEIYGYVWKPGADEPVKENDDVQDAIRYAIYSDLVYGR